MRGGGSSPLTRGKHVQQRLRWPGARLIPAHAGKTSYAHRPAACPSAHPRSRGENHCAASQISASRGSSPLTRGKRSTARRRSGEPRLIPAHAGKTSLPAVRSPARPAHPRSRGENGWVDLERIADSGSSPLTRGKPRPRRLRPTSRRLIPAHAGKTARRVRARGSPQAHPRSRGENSYRDRHEGGDDGSSPLTRGKHQVGEVRLAHQRLIPAHAGKTRPRWVRLCA